MAANAASAAVSTWELPSHRSESRRDDPLLECLRHVAELLGAPTSNEALVAGLPIEDDGLTPTLFMRAAAHAGLNSRVVHRALGGFGPLTLPAVLLLVDRRACVLLGVDSSTGVARVILPETGGAHQLPMADLARDYTGHALLVQLRPRLDARSGSTGAHTGSGHWFWQAMKLCWPTYGEALLASLLINLFALAVPFFSMQVYDRVVPNLIFTTLWTLGTGMLIVLAFDALMRALRAYFIDVAGKRVDVTLSAQIFAAVLGIRLAGRPVSAGAFASNVQDFEAFREFVTSATITTLVDLPFVLLFVCAAAWIGGPIAWIPVLAFPLIVGIGLAVYPKLAAVVQASHRFASQRQATLVEALVGLETVKTQRAEGPLQRRWEEAVGNVARLGLRARFLSNVVVNGATLVQQLAYLAVLVLGVYLVADERLTVGGLIACGLLTSRALAPLTQVASLMTRFHHARTALRSIDTLMQLPLERPPEKTFVRRARLRGSIEFSDVHFSYPHQQVTALDSVTFRIAAGERVAIIGRVGSGKTTVERLVLGLHAPSAGNVLLDGVDSRQWDPVELRRDIGYVPQDLVLFYGSVRDNIVLGAPHAPDEAVVRAARLAGVNEFVDRHPQGFGMQVGERGEALSGGQRQAIAIARAYLHEPPVLLLDEPTHAMDNRSEEQFKERLASILPGRTLLLVTHKASLLSLVERVIVLDRGKVVADGRRDDVVAALMTGKIHGS